MKCLAMGDENSSVAHVMVMMLLVALRDIKIFSSPSVAAFSHDVLARLGETKVKAVRLHG